MAETMRQGDAATSNDREALATLLTAGSEDLAAAFGGLAGAETDLTGALLTVWAEGWLHDLKGKRVER